MKDFRVALAQIAPALGDLQRNLALHLDYAGQAAAQFQTVFLIYVNRVGCEDGLTFGGGSMVLDPLGRIVDELAPLEEGLLVTDLDAGALRRARITSPLLRDCRLDLVQRELDRIRGQRYELSDTPDTQQPGGGSLSATDANGKAQG